MNPQSAKRSLAHLCERKVPVFLWGPPGIGKSSIVAQIAKEKNIAFIDLRLSLLDPTDLRGIPFFNAENHEAIWAPPSFLPNADQSEGILFLDELNTAAPMVQASAYQLILDRKIGEYRLPDGWAIVAAGNRESDRGVVFRMASPLANRFVHLEMEASVEDWRSWAIGSQIDPSIVAFIAHRPDALFTFDTKNENRSFATPRTWAYVNEIIASEPEADLILPLVAGAIGEELAAAYLGFKMMADQLPDLDAIIDGTSNEVPEDPSALHLLSSALTMRINDHTGSKKLNNLVAYTLNLPGEFAVMIIQDLRSRGIELDHIDSWPLWMRKFNALMR
ncbi:MoxR family ATPase [uncultured Sulfuricurvum sp.]|uniref:ATP-binding protein n=1 Tax=uncultured Sulfuricurvum sp. TaxID=430693 RepID=UPI00263244BB|nr:MoxR family ATPase [uncultured Sulfuricurvum sp.]